MDASGTGTVVADLPTCRNREFNSGAKNLTATWQEIVRLRVRCEQWGGESSSCGNANFGIPADSPVDLRGGSNRVRFELDV